VIRLQFLSGSLTGTTFESPKRALRVGSMGDCDVRFDPVKDQGVANYHAALLVKDGAYYAIDTGSETGLWVNGERLHHHVLRNGDHIRFGEHGPEAEVQVTIDSNYDQAKDAEEIAKVLNIKTRETKAITLVTQAAQRVAAERAKAGGTKSRKTMEVMAETLQQVSDVVRQTSRRKWVKVVAMVAGVATVVIAIMGMVIYAQHQKIRELLTAKGQFDAQIQRIQEQMEQEQDSTRLAELERRLAEATANAQRTLADLAKTDKQKAAEAANAGDELDREIRSILRQFDAETYAVPPIFKERLAFYIDQLVKSEPTTRIIYRRKVKYWPIISAQFKALELPDAMAYVAWTESQFDPDAHSHAGAKGMWQMTVVTARSLGLKVDGTVDERTDVRKQTRAAVRYLANLLAEFGEDAFMLAMASYNRGENGVRRALHQVAQEPGGYKKEKRDFWHLYRLKKLPEETREYVPKILAAAIVCTNPQRYGLVDSAETPVAAASVAR
jgi:soluble lytic murein transglycosylase-like protein/pSer/pThr/pTyr-binding forkhead associated (FHA) protein